MGCFEECKKWNFSVKDEASYAIIEENRPDEWQSITKQRWAIELKEVLGKIVIHTSTDKLESGCLVEYTKLYSASHVWYTFGLEWFGKIYIQVPADFILDILGSTEVHFNQSKGYTSFLIGHIK